MDILGNLGHLIMAFPYYAAAVVAAAIAGMVYFVYKTTIDFWIMDALYCMPLFGRLARLSRRKVPAADHDFQGWLQSEVTLGSDYANHINPLSPESFTLYRTYLGRAGDGGREPMPGWLLAVLVALVAAEAYGISYLIAGGLARNMSENARVIGTGAIVVVICIVLVIATHAAGKHLYRNLLVGECEEKRDEAVTAADHADPKGAHLLPLETHASIKIAEAALDDDVPAYSQCINRIGERKTWFWVWGALAFIIIFGGFQVGLRVNDTLQKLTRDTIGLSAAGAAESASVPTMPNFGDVQTATEPAALSEPDRKAEQKADAEMKSTEKMGGWMTSLVLAFIYLMTQLTGIYAGYSYGFAGKYSKEAYDQTRGCQLYETYQQVEQKLIGIANRRLQSLHQKITDGTHGRIVFGGDFYSFLKIHRRRFAQLQAEAPAMTGPQPVLRRADPAPTAATAQDHMAKLEAMSAEEMKAYLTTLPPEQFARVRPQVQNLLAVRAAQARDLDELFAAPVADAKPQEIEHGPAANDGGLGATAT